MNQRIRQFAEKANIEFTYDPTETPVRAFVECWEDDLEKFVELIVKECMACSIWVGKNNTNTVEPIHTAHAINQRIKQHFGVEE
jgi:hypothetical protein